MKVPEVSLDSLGGTNPASLSQAVTARKEAVAHGVSLHGNGQAKRLFDIFVASIMLVLTAPLWVLIAVAIKLESPGPVFFRQVRIGRGGKPFKMLKFRKMSENLPVQGPMLTRRGDPRLT